MIVVEFLLRTSQYDGAVCICRIKNFDISTSISGISVLISEVCFGHIIVYHFYLLLDILTTSNTHR